MKTITVYDPPMCCSTGVCGPEADPELAQFASFLAGLAGRGVEVQRYNLAHEPLKFMEHPAVKVLLETEDSLPAILIDGEVVLSGCLPTPEEMTAWSAT